MYFYRLAVNTSCSIMPRYGLGMLSVGTRNNYAQPGLCKSLVTHWMLHFLQSPVIRPWLLVLITV